MVENALKTRGTPFLYKPSRMLGAMGTENNQETTWTARVKMCIFRSIDPNCSNVISISMASNGLLRNDLWLANSRSSTAVANAGQTFFLETHLRT